MNLKEKAKKELKKMDLKDNKYLKVDVFNYAYKNMELGYPIKFEFITEEDYVTKTGNIIEKTIEDIEGENEKCFIVKSDEDKFLVPLSEIIGEVKNYIFKNIEKVFRVEKYIEDNLKQFEHLENFNFLTSTQYGIELEGGWNGALRLDKFNKVTDNSFTVKDREHNNEFVYNGCDKADTVLMDLYTNYPKLSNHNFAYTKNCGTHIHFSQNGMRKNPFKKLDLLKLISFLVTIEDILLDIIPNYRVATIDKLNGHKFSKEGGYSKSVYHRENKVLNTIQEIKYRLKSKEISEQNIDRLLSKLEKNWYGKHYVDKHDKYNITRYYGINLHTYFYRGSLELRYFEGNYRNIVYYMDLIDKIMFLIEKFEWETVNILLEKLDSYNKISTKTCGLLYALGVNNETLNKLLSRTDYSQLNIVKNHSLLNKIREKITNKKAVLNIPKNYKEKNIEDTTMFKNELDSSIDYSQKKNSVLQKIIDKKGELKKDNFGNMLGDYNGKDKEEFLDYIDEVSENIEQGLI